MYARDNNTNTTTLVNSFIAPGSSYARIVHEPGGAVSISGSLLAQNSSVAKTLSLLNISKKPLVFRTCTSDECGGERYCMHRYISPVSTAYAHDLRVYGLSIPKRASDNTAEAHKTLAHIIDDRVAPSEWARCGASIGVIAALGYSIQDLVEIGNYPLEHLILGLQLDWRALIALDFHIEMLRYKQLFPVIALVKAPISMNVDRLLVFQTSAKHLVDSLKLSAEELFVIGFTQHFLDRLGLSAALKSRLINDPVVQKRGGDAWWTRAFRANE